MSSEKYYIFDLRYIKNYKDNCWEVIRQISYDEDDFEVLKSFETLEECKQYIAKIGIEY